MINDLNPPYIITKEIFIYLLHSAIPLNPQPHSTLQPTQMTPFKENPLFHDALNKPLLMESGESVSLWITSNDFITVNGARKGRESQDGASVQPARRCQDNASVQPRKGKERKGKKKKVTRVDLVSDYALIHYPFNRLS